MLSIVLATFNEEENLGQCLSAVKEIADEIIVVDGSSVDRTREIASSFGAKIIKTTNKSMFHINKQIAINEAKGDWVLQLDADEVVDQVLLKSIKAVLKQGSKYNAFYLQRKNFFLGKFLTKGGQYPDPVIRFFKQGKAKLPQQSVHEQMLVSGPTGTLEGHILHYSSPTFSRYLTNANRYTSLTAAELRQQNLVCNTVNTINYLIFKPLFTFFNIFFRHKGFVDGFQGFVFALFSGLHYPIAYMKFWEMRKK